MTLTPENQAAIDAKGIEQLLAGVRFSPTGDPWFEGETGKYWLARMMFFQDRDLSGFINASKRIGWDRAGSVPPDFSTN